MFGRFFRRIICHATDGTTYISIKMAISLSSLLYVDVNWFHLFNSILSYTCLHGAWSLLCTYRYASVSERFFLLNDVDCLAPYFHLRNRSYSSVLIFIVSSWAIPFAIWPMSIFLGQHFSSSPPSCVHPANPYIIVVLCSFFYYIPLLFMLCCYSRIIVNIKNIEVMVRHTIVFWLDRRVLFTLQFVSK